MSGTGSDQNMSCNQDENSELLTIDELPEVALLKVFSYLLLPGRKHVRLVNKRWNELCNTSRLTEHETFCFIDRPIADLDNIHISRAFINLKFDIVDINNATPQLQFWQEHGSRVKTIEIRNSTVEDRVLYDYINCCPNLEHLSLVCVVSGSDSATNANISCNKLEMLTELVLTNDSSNHFAVDKLTKNVPKLKHLSVYFEEVENGTIFADTMSLIKRQCDTLEMISFEGYSCPKDGLLYSLKEEIGVQLTGLSIPHCTILTDNVLSAIAHKFVNLERLDVGANSQLGLNLDPSLFSNLKKLKLVRLSYTSITDQVLSAVVALEQIEGLDVSSCDLLTAPGISQALGTQLKEKLLDIRLMSIWCVTDQVLAQILPQLPNLRSIDVSGCRKISTVGLSTITANCKLLRLLSVGGCYEIRSLVIADMKSLQGLLYLDLSNSSLDVDTVGGLQYLDLQIVSLLNVRLTVEGLHSLLVNCPSLQHVVHSVHRFVPNLETGRKCPTLSTMEYFHPPTIFQVSKSYFNSIPLRV